MSKTRSQVKAVIQQNLIDLAINFYSDDDMNQSIQDAYDDIAILTQCIQKRITLNWISDLSYYNFQFLGLTDYLGTIGIFNNVTNLWLRDDVSIKDFDRIRRDWELWIGTPQFWAPSDPFNIAIAAKYLGAPLGGGAFDPYGFSSAHYIGAGSISSLGSFILFYWALAPTLASDSDTFLIATDMQNLLPYYVTADLAEQAQEFNKAQQYWTLYDENINAYADRVKRNTKSDLLLRV